MNNNSYFLNDLKDTKQLATIIANIAQPNLILLLNGTLGSGKTQLTKLISEILGVSDVITSPTFIIWNQYTTKHKWNLIHMDAYRLNNVTQLDEYYEIMANNFMIIEWPDKLPINWQHHMHIEINFTITSATKRMITVNTNLLTNKDKKQLEYDLNCLFTIKNSTML
ncbi:MULTISPECIES: tRNA (adenosine(37)-N6)-threonylcarbamoyltransferase complex ATPase subunit type 1 TsaE [unclassified Spiroplasma]|uniref:tRNA (adenosine(37)-N6)-threonylcarbamoyltransferase complex ATPase subunit type 1 TsaE n=1 Tax=unclassified Spiroplasma TaxID=2637901 RepID=UPI0027E09342|nr:tRNA (adenosine(37)-N6)-threonylcarbamoyltransferase complex ATPase subunit type 1 TsaE [Spiroplasma sp. AdecLV25b]